jgi:hypothetical protein
MHLLGVQATACSMLRSDALMPAPGARPARKRAPAQVRIRSTAGGLNDGDSVDDGSTSTRCSRLGRYSSSCQHISNNFIVLRTRQLRLLGHLGKDRVRPFLRVVVGDRLRFMASGALLPVRVDGSTRFEPGNLVLRSSDALGPWRSRLDRNLTAAQGDDQRDWKPRSKPSCRRPKRTHNRSSMTRNLRGCPCPRDLLRGTLAPGSSDAIWPFRQFSGPIVQN